MMATSILPSTIKATESNTLLFPLPLAEDPSRTYHYYFQVFFIMIIMIRFIIVIMIMTIKNYATAMIELTPKIDSTTIMIIVMKKLL